MSSLLLLLPNRPLVSLPRYALLSVLIIICTITWSLSNISFLQNAGSSTYPNATEELEQAKSAILDGRYDADFAKAKTWAIPVVQCYAEKIATGNSKLFDKLQSASEKQCTHR